MKVSFSLSIGYPSATHEDTFDFPENSTDDEIEAEFQEWSSNYIEGFWEKVKTKDIND